MLPTWLYVKRQPLTGLLYFGKTTKDPFKYRGSGAKWVRHLLVHGKDVETIWCKVFHEKALLVKTALAISKHFDISNSPQWANLIPENGLDGGGNQGIPATSEAREKNRISHLGQVAWNKNKHLSKEHKAKLAKPKTAEHKTALRKPKSRTENMKGPQRILTCACSFSGLCSPFTRYHKPKCSSYF